MSQKIRRSLLYAPADKEDLMEKALSTNADVVIYDLEDACHPTKKDEARNNIKDILDCDQDRDKEIFVRMNGLETEYWLDDLEACLTSNVDGVKIPMVEKGDHLSTIISVADQLESNLPELFITLETPKGFFNWSEIEKVCDRVPQISGLSYGIGDFCNAIGSPGLPQNINDFLRFYTVNYATLVGIEPYGTVYTDIDDLDGLKQFSKEFYDLGYSGQAAIHPKQVDIINDSFTPDEKFVENARNLIREYDNRDTDSIVINDTFLDTAIIERYRKIVNRYDSIRNM